MRREPYTEEEIKECKCYRCHAPAMFQWQICSDGNVYRPICLDCDIELNRLVLQFMGFPDWEKKIKTYERQKRASVNLKRLRPVVRRERS
jgi:hypothetical protein